MCIIVEGMSVEVCCGVYDCGAYVYVVKHEAYQPNLKSSIQQIMYKYENLKCTPSLINFTKNAMKIRIRFHFIQPPNLH